MSQFSDACKALIKNKNTTVYRMSKDFGLDDAAANGQRKTAAESGIRAAIL